MTKHRVLLFVLWLLCHCIESADAGYEYPGTNFNQLSASDGVFTRLYPTAYDNATKLQSPCGGPNTRSANPGIIFTNETSIKVIKLIKPLAGNHTINILDSSLKLKGVLDRHLMFHSLSDAEKLFPYGKEVEFVPSKFGFGPGANGTIQHVFSLLNVFNLTNGGIGWTHINETWYQCADFTVMFTVSGGVVQSGLGIVRLMVLCVAVSTVLLF
ncbi:hypothetical protein BJ742DRAFT_827558 [Cladochytrium replicatum]|nr:hypothetical protein BJ742DRAFT_827558 [Cladochytrium replicatum]